MCALVQAASSRNGSVFLCEATALDFSWIPGALLSPLLTVGLRLPSVRALRPRSSRHPFLPPGSARPSSGSLRCSLWHRRSSTPHTPHTVTAGPADGRGGGACPGSLKHSRVRDCPHFNPAVYCSRLFGVFICNKRIRATRFLLVFSGKLCSVGSMHYGQWRLRSATSDLGASADRGAAHGFPALPASPSPEHLH